MTGWGKYLFVDTGNGVDEAHLNIPAPKAPSHVCFDKNTGKVLWTDNSPGINVLHGQWSSPCVFEAGGQEQVVFGRGMAGCTASIPRVTATAAPSSCGNSTPIRKSRSYLLGGRATRNHIIGTPTFYDGPVYSGVGEDPEHGEGVGHL